MVHSTKDCVLQFDQDNHNGGDRKGKRDLFLNDIYYLAQHWSDYVNDGIGEFDLTRPPRIFLQS